MHFHGKADIYFKRNIDQKSVLNAKDLTMKLYNYIYKYKYMQLNGVYV